MKHAQLLQNYFCKFALLILTVLILELTNNKALLVCKYART